MVLLEALSMGLIIAKIIMIGWIIVSYAWLISLFYAFLLAAISFVFLRSLRNAISEKIPMEFLAIGSVWVFALSYFVIFGFFSDWLNAILLATLGLGGLFAVTMMMLSFLRG